MDLYNVLILYYDTPLTARVSQMRLGVVPVKFIQVMMPERHLSPLEVDRHDQKTVFWYW